MLSINDASHLKLLYEQLIKANAQIKQLILDDDWESVDYAIQNKAILLKKIMSFEKPRIEDIKATPELMQMRLKIVDVEKENIELVKSLKTDAMKEMSNVKKARKILNAYEPASNHTVSTFEVIDD